MKEKQTREEKQERRTNACSSPSSLGLILFLHSLFLSVSLSRPLNLVFLRNVSHCPLPVRHVDDRAGQAGTSKATEPLPCLSSLSRLCTCFPLPIHCAALSGCGLMCYVSSCVSFRLRTIHIKTVSITYYLASFSKNVCVSSSVKGRILLERH